MTQFTALACLLFFLFVVCCFCFRSSVDVFVRGCCPRCVAQGRLAEVAFVVVVVVVVIVCAFVVVAVVVVVNIVVVGCLLIVLRSDCVGVYVVVQLFLGARQIHTLSG